MIIALLCLVGSYSLYKGPDNSTHNATNDAAPEKPRRSLANIGDKLVAPPVKLKPEKRSHSKEPLEKPLVDAFKRFELLNTPQAKLDLALLLRSCSQSTPSVIANIDELDTLPNINVDRLQKIKSDLIRDYNRCEGLYDYLPNANFRELSLAWIEDSAEEGHPVARLESLYRYPDLPLVEEVLPLIYESFELAETEPKLLENIYFSLLSHHSDNIDNKVNHDNHLLSSNRDAWDYLACLNTSLCDVDELVTGFQGVYHQHEVGTIVERATQLQAHIDNRNWEALDLDPAKY